jgi:hypothetical protein
VRAVLVVMRDVLRQGSLEMTATEDEEPVEALPADAADEALGKRVIARLQLHPAVKVRAVS